MADNKRVYRLGVVGLGEGRSILSAALASPQWELVNICDLDEALCLKRRAEFNFPRHTTDYETLLADPSIEVIAIYTPDQWHAAHIVQALDAGKHVICTKPLLSDLSQAQPVREALKRSGKHLFVGQSSRFFEPFRHQRDDYLAGRLGEVGTVDASYITDARWFLDKPWSRKPGFSWMYNFLIHPVDLIRWYSPDIEEVFGLANTSANTTAFGLTVPDNLRFLTRDSAGRIGQIGGNYAGPTLGKEVEPAISCTLRGTQGVSRAWYPKLRYEIHREGEPVVVRIDEERREHYFRFEADSHHAGEYQNYLEYFSDCLDRGEAPLPDFAEGVGTLVLMKALEQTLATGKPMFLRDAAREHGVLDLMR